jgi:uridine phosphorylase
LQPHLRLRAGQVAATVLLPGDPGRVARVAEHLSAAQPVAQNREYTTWSGLSEHTPVSVTSTGIGCPSTAIAVEELANVGVRTLIRIGTCGALQSGIAIGDLVVAEGAVRADGTSLAYVPAGYPAIADATVVSALVGAAVGLGVPVHRGVVYSGDALYPELEPERTPRATALAEEAELWRRAGVLAADMESSALLVVGRLRGLSCASALLVVNSRDEATIDPDRATGEPLDRLIAVALAAVRSLDPAEAGVTA